MSTHAATNGASGTAPRSASSRSVAPPPAPRSITETGLHIGALAELTLKHIYFAGMLSGQELADEIKLPFFDVLDDVLSFLRQEEYIEVIGAQRGLSERGFEYAITSKGRTKVQEALARSQYVGPAPVSLDAYLAVVAAQALGDVIVDQAAIRAAFRHLVVSDHLLDQIGPAANSARSLFLYGPPGNGKTTIAEAIAQIVHGHILVPHAIDVDGHVIKVYDPLCHRPVSGSPISGAHSDSTALDPPTIDERWVLCDRPVVIVGGELLLSQLELIYDPISKVYEAPYQMKANGGLFLIDDFGRQQCRPQDLLNRWIVPLERRVDYLALQTGKKLSIPFDVLIMFLTNLDPKQLVDDAFLRRIRHKIAVPNPTPAEYRAIFQDVCASRGIPYQDAGFQHLLSHYRTTQRELRCCHPRDLCDHLLDEAKYRGVAPQMSTDLLDRAWSAYFVNL